ncbi:MAG: M20/M25/M40 family metallo-hydrolase [Gemmatimonadetes bacterium]|nr:M20/M25/M40 family metallo-hydrolase [Gemmatimonadota bacterium]
MPMITSPPLLTLSLLLAGSFIALGPGHAHGQQVESARLIRDLSVLAHDSMQGRAPGTPQSAKARAFVIEQLAAAGARPIGDSFEYPFETPRASGVNVVARIAGKQPDAPAIVLTAHYDHEGVRGGIVYNGADDNASGVVTALAIARALRAEPLDHPLVIAFVDAEEAGMVGSRALVGAFPIPLSSVGLNVNLDMVARTEGTLWAAGAHHTPALRPVLESVAARPPVRLRLGHDSAGAPEGADWTRSSDHAPFHAAGIPFVYFGVEDHEDYHRPSDDTERVSPDEFLASVQTILAALHALDAALPSLREPTL